jgi:hypothetical protein
MNKNEKQVRDEIYKTMRTEFDKLEKCKSRNEKSDKLQFLYRMNKILENYDELTPVLEEYFEKKHNKEKWRDER